MGQREGTKTPVKGYGEQYSATESYSESALRGGTEKLGLLVMMCQAAVLG